MSAPPCSASCSASSRFLSLLSQYGGRKSRPPAVFSARLDKVYEGHHNDAIECMSNTIMASAATVIGARHLRMARNGQDAVATWVGDGAAAAVVCDGCGSGASS